MKITLLVLLVIFLSKNVYAFDYCSELKKAVEICCAEVKAIDSNFDSYLSRCDVKETVYDTVEDIYVPVEGGK